MTFSVGELDVFFFSRFIFVQFMKRPNLTFVNIVEVLFHKWVTCIDMLGKHTMLNQTKLEVDEKENS